MWEASMVTLLYFCIVLAVLICVAGMTVWLVLYTVWVNVQRLACSAAVYTVAGIFWLRHIYRRRFRSGDDDADHP